MDTLWGIDLGGTKIEGVIMPLGSDTPICRERIDTQSEFGYDHILSRIEVLLKQMENVSGLPRGAAIGFGTPGAEEPATGLMKNCNTTSLNGRPLPTDLSERLGVRAVVANDANCFALAEATLGAGKGASTVFGVIMGTGVGGGIIIDGRVLAGAQGIAGEWGHNVLIPGGESCYCGKRGCVEMVISGPALQRFYTNQTGVKRTLKEIVARVDEDPAAEQTIDRLVTYFGEAISVVINILDPEVIVLGGGVGNVSALYDEGAKVAERNVFQSQHQEDKQMRTRIVPPLLGDSAGVFGAAMLVREL